MPRPRQRPLLQSLSFTVPGLGLKPRYLRMLDGLQRAEPTGSARCWSVYIVRCADASLYTGIAKDVRLRLKKHNAGRGAAYTRARRPVELAYSEMGLSRSEALVREAEIKSFPRPRKDVLLESREARPAAGRARRAGARARCGARAKPST